MGFLLLLFFGGFLGEWFFTIWLPVESAVNIHESFFLILQAHLAHLWTWKPLGIYKIEIWNLVLEDNDKLYSFGWDTNFYILSF